KVIGLNNWTKRTCLGGGEKLASNVALFEPARGCRQLGFVIRGGQIERANLMQQGVIGKTGRRRFEEGAARGDPGLPCQGAVVLRDHRRRAASAMITRPNLALNQYDCCHLRQFVSDGRAGCSGANDKKIEVRHCRRTCSLTLLKHTIPAERRTNISRMSEYF